MYNITWSTECPDSSTFDQLKSCFVSHDLSQSQLIPCTDGYDSVFQTTMFTSTVTTDWQLVCDNQWIDTILTLLVMAGLLFGVFSFGPVIDRIGRRKTIMIACIGLATVQVHKLTLVMLFVSLQMTYLRSYKSDYVLFTYGQYNTVVII